MNREASYLRSESLSFTGAILLDVENFPLKLDLEQVLKPYCRYPITVKFAVANWLNSSISKLDRYLHQQGYQLIHVPKQQNAADAQILTLGASLQLQYPQIKEVVVVSGDSIFEYLHQTLQRQGCNTYKVYQHSGYVYIHDFTDNSSSIIAQVATQSQQNPEVTEVTAKSQQQNLEDRIQAKIKLTLEELSQKLQTEITLTQLCQEFKNKHKKTISQLLKSNKLPKSTLGFIQNHCTNKIDIKIKNKIYYLTLKS